MRKYTAPRRVKRFKRAELDNFYKFSRKLVHHLGAARSMVDHDGRLPSETVRMSKEYAEHMAMVHAIAWALADAIPSRRRGEKA